MKEHQGEEVGKQDRKGEAASKGTVAVGISPQGSPEEALNRSESLLCLISGSP